MDRPARRSSCLSGYAPEGPSAVDQTVPFEIAISIKRNYSRRVTDQRSGATRRRFLRTASLAGLAGLAGCTGSGATGSTGGLDGSRSATIALLAAGSLQHALERGLKPAVDVPVRVETHGSTTVARMIAEGQRDPDVVSVADTALFEAPLSPSWYSVFASNAVVLAYNPDTEGGRRIAAAGNDRWYEPLAEGAVDLGRTDPDQDPLGYRALFALELASRYYDDAPALREIVPGRGQVYPETALLGQFETGAIDAALAYRNMAVERGYEYVDLPDQVDLSNPAHESEWYSTVSYTLPNGRQIRGGLIGYASTIRNMSDPALSVFDVHTTGDYLASSGFLLRERFPSYTGTVPDAVREATAGRESGALGESSLPAAVSGITVLV
jgi:molybdate/tungstate transport system substrate-binding protein